MEGFFLEVTEGKVFELFIDTNIFSKEIIFKVVLSFLDRGYFFFKKNQTSIILQFTRREESTERPEKIILDFSDSLLEFYLRDTLEKENQIIREVIVNKTINGPLDKVNFVTLDTDKDKGPNVNENRIDFDKDISEILKEIREDPHLNIDEKEIDRILQEVETESKTS